jgi:formate hydrogenlyase subunit 4
MMNAVIGALLAILVYPGLLVALLAAWALTWVRASTFAAAQGRPLSHPLAFPDAVRTSFDKEAIVPAGVFIPAITAAALVATVFPLLALIFLPLPGNPLVSAIGLQGDIIAAGAFLLAAPLARLFVGWVSPSPYTRLAADRSARLLAGAVLPAVLALTATAQTFVSLRLDTITTPASVPTIILLTRALAAAAFACALPVLARATTRPQVEQDTPLPSSELGEISGRHLAIFRVAEALQLVAVAAVFVSVFIIPLASGVTSTGVRYLIWALAVIAVAVGVALWDALHHQAIERTERPPVTWWLGVPVLLALAALVAAAWAGRGP